jgi:hypothetical protein|tara:strand:- start:11333 stop:11446 length:114 start_codon:yes stop_codon:yes gene_type:complete
MTITGIEITRDWFRSLGKGNQKIKVTTYTNGKENIKK